MLGLEKGIVKLAPYTDAWMRAFEAEKILLQEAVGALALDIQHVGSTSVPGLLAKPIVDIGMGVEDFEAARIGIPMIERAGYEYRGEYGIPRRHYFVKGDPRLFHLHMAEIRSAAWQNMLLFRDTLRQSPETAEEYSRLKMELAERYPRDREAYLAGKAEFIERVLEWARAWEEKNRR